MKLGTFPDACDLVIDVPVTLDAGHPWGADLTGVTIEARAGLIGGTVFKEAVITVSGTTIKLQWVEWTFTRGTWRLEVLGTKGGLTLPIDLASDVFTIIQAIKPRP